MGCNCNQGNNQGSGGSSCCNLKAMDVVTPAENISNGDKNFCFSEITDQICENLQNDEGINPSATHANTDCDDLSSLNDLGTGSLHNSLMTLNMCDLDAYKCWLDSLLSWNWNIFKAIICAICGLWCHVRDLYNNDNILQAEIICLSEELKKLYEKVYGVSKIGFQSSGSGLTWVSNTGVPSWSSGDSFKNPATWAAVADVEHSNYWLSTNNDNTQAAFYMQYGGQGNGWASARFINYGLTITKQKYNDDNSLYVEYALELGHFKGHATDAGGISVKYDIKMQGKTEWSYSGDTGDDLDVAPQDGKITGSATIPLGGSHTGALIDFNVSYPNGEFSPNNFKIGVVINNPDVPMDNCLQDIDQFEDGSCTKK